MRSSPEPRLRSLRSALALAFLRLHAVAAHGPETAATTPVTAATEVCEFRTINYITHTLPQQCLRTSWSSPTQTAAADPTITIVNAPTATDPTHSEAENATQSGEQGIGDGQEEPVASGFMSFEEWKEMMLRKSGQDPANIKAHKPREHKVERDTTGNIGEPDSVGEEGEISLDFDALTEKVSEITSSSSSGDAASRADKDKQEVEEQVLYDDGKTQYYRSKDAGTTCKERHSFASFDAGATIKKTSKGAKNAKAILAENKDSYMLLECQAKDKFVIVELSDDILVDTVVLANFEFFSSMIRKFRVSASDRYPVKPDKWVDLGTFEARNARDIQAFLVEHPQIYTKYIRIEFLTHYGNEYYCPVSLLRVHGTRMLDTWKEPREDDEPELIEGSSAQEIVAETREAQQPSSTTGSATSNTTEEIAPEQSPEMGLSPWQPIFHFNLSHELCAPRSPTTDDPSPVSMDAVNNSSKPTGHTTVATAQPPAAAGAHKTSKGGHPSSQASVHPESPVTQGGQTSATVASSSVPSPPAQQANQSNAAGNQGQKQPVVSDTPQSAAASPKPTGGSTTTTRNKTSAASSSTAPLPTVQESFFKTVTKRLSHLESNTSLSLQYIEQQSRFLQDVLLKLERKQLGKVDSFLDTLNKTVLTELRNVRTQYDQIWQSTVIALETQREQSQQEIVALTTRLNVLADEVVFQKRMAIFQSFLLLSCLMLVIFNSSNASSSSSSSSFAIPPGSAAAAYYRRYASGFGGGGGPRSESGLSASPLPPTPGGPLLKEQRSFESPSPPSGASTLAASALPRHLLYSSASLLGSRTDKSLPLTPEYSRENTPASPPPPGDIILSPSPSGYEQGGGGDETPVRRRHRHRRPSTATAEDDEEQEEEEEESEKEDGDDQETPESNSSESPQKDQQEWTEQQTAAPPSAPPPTVRQRSQLGVNSGGIRKPLPALPEDPS
ncbi:UNC-like C-terminal-domain-containing protein [Cladorrhinum sp. PSN332]|nr:UNC-like C-terminal-domain-containing protein [Cladorrhinum sp. PSN332]